MIGIRIEACLSTLLYVILFSLSVSLSTVVLHELGHYLTGLALDCRNIRLVLIDSEQGTYTQMNCPKEQPAFFGMIGAFMLALPFSLLFLLLKGVEKNLSFISFGFNLMISLVDIPVLLLQPVILFVGLSSVVFGECLLVDKSLISIERGL